MSSIVPNRTIVRQVLKGFKRMGIQRRDRYAKKLRVWNTSLLYLEGILRRRRSVKDIAQHVKSSPRMQKLAELKSIDPSALNRRLDDVPPEVLKQTYQELVAQYKKEHGLPKRWERLGPLAAVDSSSITLGKVRGEWAYMQRRRNAVKLHVRLDLGSDARALPSRVVLSTAAVADQDEEVTQELIHPDGVTYLLDRGFLNYGQYIEWSHCGILLVARIKANSQVRIIAKRPVHAAFVREDADVEVVHPQTGERERFRLVVYTYTDEKGKTHRVRVLTNRWDVSAEEVALMYRYRWKVELFFKFMKQQLNLAKVYSASPNAVWNQMYLNVIAYLLVELWRLRVAPTHERGDWVSLLRTYLDRPWLALLQELEKPKQKTSRGRRKKGGRPRKHPKRLQPQHIVYK